jgi:glycosyltransferase involved in cell wall biosynthesis
MVNPGREVNAGMRDQPLVSAIIPAYNAAAFIRRTLDSVFAQTYSRLEVIVVDDGSQDETAEIITRDYPRARLIRQEHQGKPRAVARAVAEATGEYLALQDHDDEWLPQKTQRQVEVMADHPGLELLIGQPLLVPLGGRPTARYQDWRIRVDGTLQAVGFRDWCFKTAFAWTWSSTSGWLVRQSSFGEIGGLADCFPVDDWEFLMRAGALGYSVAVLCEPLYHYHLTADSASRPCGALKYSPWTRAMVLAAYDPRGEGWKARLLAESEYTQWMRRVYMRCGRQALRRGEREEAGKFFRKAEEMAEREGPLAHWWFKRLLVVHRAYSWVKARLKGK